MYLNHLVCDQGSNAEGRNLLLILSFAPRDFSPCSPVFPSCLLYTSDAADE